MAKATLPWHLRPSDFAQTGWHTRPTVAFELMFEFLRLSPSYDCARRLHQLGLTDSERAALPADFDQVLRTYDLLGDVQQTLFRLWWLNSGLRAFGNPHSRPEVHAMGSLGNGQQAANARMLAQWDHYLLDVRPQQGLAPTLLLAVPLGGRRSETLRQVQRLLEQYDAEEHESAASEIALMGQRLRAKTLFQGVRLLWFRAAKPTWEYWRLGAQARLSRAYSAALDPTAPRRTSDHQQRVDRDLMTKITYRALTKYQRMAENAARGRFPCDAPVEQMDWDYKALARQIRSKNTWERMEKARLLKLHQAKLAMASAR